MPDILEHSAIVMAHPDDEILWAGSAVKAAARIIVCFGELPHNPRITEGRARAMAAFPLDTVEHLDLVEADSLDSAAWPEPAESPFGLAQRRLAFLPRPAVAERYRRNFETLRDLLRPRLEGCRNVITHNPWGEYGHEDHVQVFRAVDALRAPLGFDLWVSCYYGPKSAPLQRRYLHRLGPCTAPMPIDQNLMQRIKALYIENQCWTWLDDYRWPEAEVFYRWPGVDGAPVRRRGAVFPLIMVESGWRPPPALARAKRVVRSLIAPLTAARR
jgi:LmbE family N-acetylglucosaminyl deacetylase